MQAFSALLAFVFIVIQMLRLPEEGKSINIFISVIFAGGIYWGSSTVCKYVYGKVFSLAWFIVFFVGISLPFYFLINRSGWPLNHEWFAWKFRTVAYVLHFYQWDFFPYWSSGEVFGHGAPMPLYYHKLFYQLSASVYILTGSIKASNVISLVIFGGVGVIGIYKTFRLWKLNQWAALFLALTFLFQNYTLTDWFIRGAFAEYSALMLAPWILYWSVKFVKKEVFTLDIAIILFLTYMAHSIIAYYGIFIIALSILIVLIKRKFELSYVLKTVKKAALSAFLFFLPLSIYFIPMLKLHEVYDPGKIKLDMQGYFWPLANYFYSPEYNWSTWEGYSVYLNPTLYSSLIFLLGLFIYQAVKRNFSWSDAKDLLLNPVFLLLSLALLFYFALQSSLLYSFYLIFPGADFIQFPWRLLTFIQALFLLLIGFLIHAVNNRKILIRPSIFGAYFFFLIVFTYPVLFRSHSAYPWFSEEEVELFVNDGVFGIGEYMPVLDPKPSDEYLFYKELSNALSRTDGYTLKRTPVANPEFLTNVFEIQCSNEGEVVLPINFQAWRRCSWRALQKSS